MKYYICASQDVYTDQKLFENIVQMISLRKKENEKLSMTIRRKDLNTAVVMIKNKKTIRSDYRFKGWLYTPGSYV